MIVRIWEVKRVACYARAETFVVSMVAIPLLSVVSGTRVVLFVCFVFFKRSTAYQVEKIEQ